MNSVKKPHSFYRRIGKRVFDLIVTVLSLPFWLLLLAVTAIAVRVKLGRPVLFRQERGGLYGESFRLLKFRSMTDERDADGEPLPDADRLPPFGHFLRDKSLDELPALFQVLTGRLSLVGPRPFIYDYIELYNPHQARRLNVRPGITGWAQINGRNQISWEEKFDLDVWYVENVSLWLDIKILLLTVKKVLVGSDVNSESHATMERFTGTKP